MFDKDELIPGMASYMEDTEVSVDVNVGADEPEAVAEVEETAEAEGEVQEAASEQEADADQAEMISRSFDEIERMQAFVQQHGVDRTFLYFYAPKLRALHIDVPSMESFDTVGDPHSSISIAAQEGLGKALAGVWEWIKKICQKIKNFIMKIWESLRVRFGNINKNIGRLRQALAEREDDPEALKRGKAKAQVFDIAQMTSNYNKALEFRKTVFEMKYMESFNGVLKTLEVKVMQGYKVNDGAVTSSAGSVAGDSLMGITATIEKIEKAAKEVDMIKVKAKKTPLERIPWGQLGQYLDLAAGCRQAIEKTEADIKAVRQLSERFEDFAKKAQQRGDMGAEAAGATARRLATNNNRYSSAVAKVLNNMNWVASNCVKTVAMRIATGSKKVGG